MIEFINDNIDDNNVGGLWALGEDFLNLSMLPDSEETQTFEETVRFKTDITSHPSCTKIIITYPQVVIKYADSSHNEITVYTEETGWVDNAYRYVQFGSSQEVSAEFKQFLDSNECILIDEGVIEAGDYCFRLNMYSALKTLGTRQAAFPFKTILNGTTLSFSKVNYTLVDGIYSIVFKSSTSSETVYSVPKDITESYGIFGWDTGNSSFKTRVITVSGKTYLTHKELQLKLNSLIKLNSKEFLDFAGMQEFTNSIKTLTNTCVEYAKYLKYTPVADILFRDDTGKYELSNIDLTKYLYVTIKARAGSTNNARICTSFAVRNISDCGGTMTLQISDKDDYHVWNVTNTSFKHKSGNTNARIYELVGYRWDANLSATIPEDTPTYSYKYVRGELSCASGNCFNNYYHYDKGTEFRVELAFRLQSLNSVLVSNTATSTAYWKLSVNSSGNVVYKQRYSDTTTTLTWTDWTIEPNKWYVLSLYSNNVTSTNGAQAKFNVSVVEYSNEPIHSYVSKGGYGMSCVNNSRSIHIGANNVDLRDNILIKGSKYSDLSNQNILSVNVEDAIIGGSLSLTSSDFVLTGGYVYGTEE